LLLADGVVLSSYSQNPIVAENKLPGNPASEWDISGAGSSDIFLSSLLWFLRVSGRSWNIIKQQSFKEEFLHLQKF
jgi:hypothetical protein